LRRTRRGGERRDFFFYGVVRKEHRDLHTSYTIVEVPQVAERSKKLGECESIAF
jgi:hypothetical protein